MRIPGDSSRILLVLMSLLLIQCSEVFEKAGRILVSDKEERELGMAFHRHLLTDAAARRQFPVFTPGNAAQAEMQAYVQRVFGELVRNIPEDRRPDYPFQLTVVESREKNAFAVPGGYAYITTGMLEELETEAELAGVLAHEVAHITGHHYREALAKNAALSTALNLILAGTEAGQIAQMGAGAFHQLVGLRFSRDNEEEADEEGTLLLASTGRNPYGIASFFARAEGGAVPQWLSTHPGPRNRVRNIQAMVAARPDLERLAADSSRTSYRKRFQEKVPL